MATAATTSPLPAAYMQVNASGGKNRLSSSASDARAWARQGHKVVPLYAHPPEPAA